MSSADTSDTSYCLSWCGGMGMVLFKLVSYKHAAMLEALKIAHTPRHTASRKVPN